MSLNINTDTNSFNETKQALVQLLYIYSIYKNITNRKCKLTVDCFAHNTDMNMDVLS